MTKTGWTLILITLAVLLSAVNTGRNLLYLMSVLLISLALISAVFPGFLLRRVRILRAAPTYATQFQPVEFNVELRNAKRMPVYLLSLRERGKNEGLAYVDEIAGRSVLKLAYSQVFSQRGIVPLPPVEVVCGFPFGFYEKKRRGDNGSHLIVYPYYKKISSLPPTMLDNPDANFRMVMKKPGEGLNFLYVREYHPEDGLRKIHWRSSARRGKLMVKEFEQDGHFQYLLALQPNPGIDGQDNYELGIRAAAAMSDYLLRRSMRVYPIPGGSTPAKTNPYFSERSHLTELLKILALKNPMPDRTLCEDLEPWLFLMERGVLLTVFMFREDQVEMEFLEGITRHGARIIAIRCDPQATPDQNGGSALNRSGLMTAMIRNEQELERLRLGNRL